VTTTRALETERQQTTTLDAKLKERF